MPFDLVEVTEAYLVSDKGIHTPNVIHYYPSESSVKVTDVDGNSRVYGKCLRAAYFRCMGVEAQPKSAHSEFIFGLGNATERMLIDWWKEMGIWVADHLKWYDTKYNLSGEVDVVCREGKKGPLFGVEVKSFYGYYQEAHIMGRRGKPGFPKMNHLLQTLIYTYEFPELDRFELFYMDRGGAKRTSFCVKLIKDELEDGSIVHRPEIQGTVRMDFTIEDILNRYTYLDQCIKSLTPPARDYKLKYNKNEIEKLRQSGELSASKYKKWQGCKSKTNNDWPGDWQCAYCNYTHICWDKAGNIVELALTEEEEILDVISNTE